MNHLSRRHPKSQEKDLLVQSNGLKNFVVHSTPMIPSPQVVKTSVTVKKFSFQNYSAVKQCHILLINRNFPMGQFVMTNAHDNKVINNSKICFTCC